MHGKLLAIGKTKLIAGATEGEDLVLVHNLPYVTWNDEFSVCLPGKGVWAAQTSANIFEFLEKDAIPVAYVGRSPKPMRFYAKYCTMIPIEVVVRFSNEPNSSYSKRNTDVPLGPFVQPKVEFFLKTVKKEFNGRKLEFDDPFIVDFDKIGVCVSNPKEPVDTVEAVFYSKAFGDNPIALFEEMEDIAVHVGRTLAAGFLALGWKLGDFKLEFGFTKEGKLVLADDLNNDSWRVKNAEGIECSKQQVRNDNGITPQTAINYQTVLEMTSRL